MKKIVFMISCLLCCCLLLSRALVAQEIETMVKGVVWHSTNGGADWVRVSTIPKTMTVSLPAPERLLTANAKGILYQSNNGGATWQRLPDTQQPPRSLQPQIQGVSFVTTTGSRVSVAASDATLVDNLPPDALSLYTMATGMRIQCPLRVAGGKVEIETAGLAAGIYALVITAAQQRHTYCIAVMH